MSFMGHIFDLLDCTGWNFFLDGYSISNLISITLEDQEKATFTLPYGTFKFKQMSSGLCNAPTTFPHCMILIFFDMVEDTIEVFKDDFYVVGELFDGFLDNFSMVLKMV